MYYYYWSTECYHPDNSFTLNDYIENHMPQSCTVEFIDGSYGEFKDEEGVMFSIHASGNGDCYSHKVEITQI